MYFPCSIYTHSPTAGIGAKQSFRAHALRAPPPSHRNCQPKRAKHQTAKSVELPKPEFINPLNPKTSNPQVLRPLPKETGCYIDSESTSLPMILGRGSPSCHVAVAYRRSYVTMGCNLNPACLLGPNYGPKIGFVSFWGLYNRHKRSSGFQASHKASLKWSR